MSETVPGKFSALPHRQCWQSTAREQRWAATAHGLSWPRICGHWFLGVKIFLLRNISLTLSNCDSMKGLIRPPLLLACSVERPHLTNFTLSNIITYSVDSRSIFEFDVKRPPFSINLYAAAVSANHSRRTAESFEKSYFSFVLSCSLHLDFEK